MNNENGVTLKDITSERFCIPLYQRLFAWTPKEVSKLLRDLKEHFESDRFKKEHNPYYLGMLTTIQRDGHIDIDRRPAEIHRHDIAWPLCSRIFPSGATFCLMANV